jgi:5-methyltetrahydrofolate--homocysteine methyltransferase
MKRDSLAERHHFASRLVDVHKIGRDPLEDWAKRTNYIIQEAEKWLAPLL